MRGKHLGSHISYCPAESVAVELAVGIAAQCATHLNADAEIRNDEMTVGVLKDVVGLDVVVYDILAVEVGQAWSHIADELPHLLFIYVTDIVGSRSGAIGHDEIRSVVAHFIMIGAKQAGVVETVCVAVFCTKLFYAAFVQWNIDFDGNFHVVQLLVAGKPHLAKTAASFQFDEAVAVVKQYVGFNNHYVAKIVVLLN